MNHPARISLALLALAATSVAAAEPLPAKEENLSFRNEVKTAIDKGLAWLKSQQQPDGFWSSAENPALTALPLLAFQREPTGRYRAAGNDFMAKGYQFLRQNAKEDGGIYKEGLSNYNTAVSMMALLGSGEPKDEPILTKARKFVAGQQATAMAKPELNGGFGYGPTGTSPKRQHPDLDNTLISLEALRAYAQARPNAELAAGNDLDWKAAAGFVARCQNLPGSNPEAWASDDDSVKGGFVYYPGFSNAGEVDLPNGKKALRSYGSMTYAGLLSFVYADIPKDDHRVKSALEWLGKNYTLDENPGMAKAGYYYYLHLATKGLAASGVDTLVTADGRKVNWTHDIASKLMNLQANDGSWVNDTARWMEKDPVLVTTYSVMALELIYQKL